MIAPTMLHRRDFFTLAAAGLALAAPMPAAATEAAEPRGEPTKFQIACMTLPYCDYPLERALTGIQAAGFHYVAWGTTHKNDQASKGTPVMPLDASAAQAKELGERCRAMGLAPLLMFSDIYPEAPTAVAVLTQRIVQAEAAGIGQVLTFGHTEGQNRRVWVERFKQLGPIARDHGVTLVIKQHGETGRVTGEIVREVDHANVQVNYDAGNVMDYTKGEVNPLDDIATVAESIHSFCIKDHRMFPISQDCGPGFGEIDHYRLLHRVAFTGRTMPLCCENISAPKFHPTNPEQIDRLAQRAREHLEMVVLALQT